MLKRKMLDQLYEWKGNHAHECLLIKGARQVGKSYIVNEFGRCAYEHFVSIDLLVQETAREAFAGALTADEIYKRLSLVVPGFRLVPGNTLLFLDEIQECPEARTALKYLAIDGRCDVIASGSLLGLSYREAGIAHPSSIPVGYERQIEMFPLDFEEFLWAMGFDKDSIAALREYVKHPTEIPQAVHRTVMDALREYLAIGGMPEVVQEFASSHNFAQTFDVMKKVLDSYLDDIARYAESAERVKARACYLSLTRQLAQENTKFKYSLVENRGSSRKFSGSIDWLEGARMVLRCRAVRTPEFPLAAYEDDSRFRLYANDTGLLVALYGFEMLKSVVTDKLKGPMKGGLYENLVASMLEKQGLGLRYWRTDKGDREIEFLLEHDAAVVPVEVKAKRGATASLNAMLQRDDVSLGFKFIDGNAGRDGKKVTLPLYLAAFIRDALEG